jgi:hypothetical protein
MNSEKKKQVYFCSDGCTRVIGLKGLAKSVFQSMGLGSLILVVWQISAKGRKRSIGFSDC